MTLSEISSIATAISGFAVTVSLVYLAIQTQQNVRHTRALIHQGTAARTTALLLGFMNAEVAAAWIEGNGGTATPEAIRHRQFEHHCGSAMIAMEDYFTQHEAGLLNHEQFARGRETFRVLLREPGMRAYWKRQREAFGAAAPNYCAFVDSLCGEQTLA